MKDLILEVRCQQCDKTTTILNPPEIVEIKNWEEMFSPSYSIANTPHHLDVKCPKCNSTSVKFQISLSE